VFTVPSLLSADVVPEVFNSDELPCFSTHIINIQIQSVLVRRHKNTILLSQSNL